MTQHSKEDNQVPVARYLGITAIFAAICLFAIMRAGGAPNPMGPDVNGIPIIPILLFVGMLGSLLVLHAWNLEVSLGGLATLLLYNVYTGQGAGADLAHHFAHEAPGLANLAFMIAGFAVVAKLFEESKAGDAMPRWLPDNWRGGAMLIMMVALMSAFLDNIAACLIGGVIAKKVFYNPTLGRSNIGVGYIAALVMAANLGGAPSPIGDTTTIMLVNAKISATEILRSIPGTVVASLLLAWFAGRQQDKVQRIIKDEAPNLVVNTRMLVAVGVTLVFVIVSTLTIHVTSVGVWGGLIVCGAFAFHHIPWSEGYSHSTVRSSLFLATLVACASLMPKFLPPPTWYYTGVLGFGSAFFDNIPLTDLAIRAAWGMWGLLAYSVGSGGSMMWFGSSAGVTLTKESEFAAGRSAWLWIKHGWHVPVTFVAGFATIMLWRWILDQLGLMGRSWPIELAMFGALGALTWHMRQRPRGHIQTTTVDV